MNNTYLNEGMTSHYPFSPDCTLPFSNSIVTDLRVCTDGTASNLSVTRLEVADGCVRATIAATVGGKRISLATLSASYGPSQEGLSVDAVAGVPVAGIMQTGVVTAMDEGIYDGNFELDPTCVTVMPAASIPALKGFSAGGETVSGAGSLEMTSSGFLELSLGTASGGLRDVTIACSTESWQWLDTGVEPPVMVNSINGLSAGTSLGVHRLLIDFSSSGATISSSSVTGGTFILVDVLGGTGFPNCYASGMDQANIRDSEQLLSDGGITGAL